MAVTKEALDSLPQARQSVLRALKEAGELSAEELAQRLGMTPGGARQHLAALRAEGLVQHREVTGLPGRPRFRYQLAPAAEALFPKRYGDLTNELLEYVNDAQPELVGQLFERRRDRRVARAQARLAPLSGFRERVQELARILDEDGYLADFAELPDGEGYRVTEHNCAILAVAQRWGHACGAEIEFLRAALPEASIERVAHMLAGGHVCAYEVRPKAA